MFQILYELVFRNSFRTGGKYLQIIQATKFNNLWFWGSPIYRNQSGGQVKHKNIGVEATSMGMN